RRGRTEQEVVFVQEAPPAPRDGVDHRARRLELEAADLAPAPDAGPRRRLDLPRARLAPVDARERVGQAGEVDRPHRLHAGAQALFGDRPAGPTDAMAQPLP